MALLVSNKIRTEGGARLFGIDGLPKRATVISALVVCGERPSDGLNKHVARSVHGCGLAVFWIGGLVRLY